MECGCRCSLGPPLAAVEQRAHLGEVAFFTGDLGLTTAEDMNGVIEERGGPVPVLVIATDAAGAMHVMELEDGGHGIAVGRTEFPKLGTTNLWGIASGDFEYEDP